MALSVGIDLGMSTFEIAVFKNGKPEFVRDIRNSRSGILPSAVALGPMGDLVVGDTAYRDPAGIRNVKRSMGTGKVFTLGERELRPEEVSARILRHLKENAERVFADEIGEALITVPAAFRDRERQATIDAGKLAGLPVERIINEPTAAALSYGLDQLDNDQHVVVFDLGGGTLDVSVLEMVKGVFEVKASAGEKRLGGVDFDHALAKLIAQEIEREHSLRLFSPDGPKERKAEEAVRAVAEQAKIDLSSQEAATVDIPFIGDRSIRLHTVVTRREFEIATRYLVDRTSESIDRALKDAGLDRSAVDVVILVGGSTRIPAIREEVGNYFDGRALPEHVPPDEAVALGAAIQAALKSGEIDSARSLIVTDVNSHSLGVAVLELVGGMLIPDRMGVIIPRQTTVPVKRTEQYATVHDGQTGVHVRVYQGESSDAAKNDLLDDFKLTGIPPAPAGQESIDITFGLGLNQLLHVDAVVVNTGETASVLIEPTKGRMTEEQKAEAARLLEEEWKKSKFFKRVEPLLAAARRAKRDLEGADLLRLEQLEGRLKDALAANDEDAVDALDRELTDLLFDLQ